MRQPKVKKRKGESDQGGRGDNRREHNRRQNWRRGNAGAMTNAAPNNIETGAGGSGGASGSGGAGGSGGTGGNVDGTGVRGTGPTVPELTGCTYATFIKCDPLTFNGTEGAVGLCQWFEKLKSVFQISECKEKDRSIRGDVTSSQPATINDAVRLAYQLTGQLIQDKANEATEAEKTKGEGDRGSCGDNRREHNRRQNQRRGNAGAMTNVAPNNNETCQK
nr:putative reverse transcriptase domain-containing protein [Tanacetum cinerariifolium]